MKKYGRLAALAFVVMSSGVAEDAAALALRTDALLKKMEQAVESPKSTEMDLLLTTNTEGAKTEMKGQYKGAADGNKFAIQAAGMAGERAFMASIVGDGKFLWTEHRFSDGRVSVHKVALATLEKLGGSEYLRHPIATMRERFEFTDLRDGKLDEKQVYVLEGKIRKGLIDQQVKVAEEAGGAVGAQAVRRQLEAIKKTSFFIDKSSLQVVTTETLDGNDEVIKSLHYKNVKTGVVLDEKDFTYTPPEGIAVQDLDVILKQTKQGSAGNEK